MVFRSCDRFIELLHLSVILWVLSFTRQGCQTQSAAYVLKEFGRKLRPNIGQEPFRWTLYYLPIFHKRFCDCTCQYVSESDFLDQLEESIVDNMQKTDPPHGHEQLTEDVNRH